MAANTACGNICRYEKLSQTHQSRLQARQFLCRKFDYLLYFGCSNLPCQYIDFLFAFLFLVATVTHILALMQDDWVGWVVDLIIITVIIVFTPIAFFNLIIFQSNAFLQIISCLTLAVGLYALSYPALSRKKI